MQIEVRITTTDNDIFSLKTNFYEKMSVLATAIQHSNLNETNLLVLHGLDSLSSLMIPWPLIKSIVCEMQDSGS